MTETKQNITKWPVAAPPTLREQTVKMLRDALLNQVFKSGEKLVERTLADRTGVSRTCIREALSQLEAEGLVTRVPGKGVFVTQVTESEATQIYEARVILEAAMARLFSERADESDLLALEAAIADAEATNSPDEAQLHAQKLDHVSNIIMQGAGNEVTYKMASLLRTRITFLRTITSRAASAERRRETMKLLNDILAAFRARDSDLAERLTRSYVERSARYAIDILRRTNA